MVRGTLGKYRIVRELGQGGMGSVYLGAHVETGQEFAVKVLAPELGKDKEFLVRFRREVQLLSKLDHPNIVRLFEAGTEDNLHYYVMEFVTGESLEEYLKRTRLTELDTGLHFLKQIASGLQAAHSVGIIHRDIKPSNVLLDGMTVKITDFGIARGIDSTRVTTTGGIIGTPEYIAPEQAEGTSVDHRVDIYSLGVLAYNIFTGHLPFQGKTALEIIQKHRFAIYESPRQLRPDLPMPIVNLIKQMLEKHRSKRIPSALAVEREIGKIQKTRAMIAAKYGSATEDQTLIDRPPGEKVDSDTTRFMHPIEQGEVAPAEHKIPIYHRPAVWTAAGIAVLLAISLGFWLRDIRRNNDPEWLFYKAVSLNQEHYFARAQKMFEDLAERFPEHRLAEYARKNAAILAEKRAEKRRKKKEKAEDSSSKPYELLLPSPNE